MAEAMIFRYGDELNAALRGVKVTDHSGSEWCLPSALIRLGIMVRSPASASSLTLKSKVMLVGNGGSSAIASHIAIDYSKNGGWPAMALNDPAALTCLSNDLGFEHVFSSQIRMLARHGDLVILISSSGRSKNILRAADAARGAECAIITFTGFDADNHLRRLGFLNFWVPSHEYGIVETVHQILLHFIVSQKMGWVSAEAPPSPELGTAIAIENPRRKSLAAAPKRVTKRVRDPVDLSESIV